MVGDRVNLVGHPECVGVVIHRGSVHCTILWDDDASENTCSLTGRDFGEPFVEWTGRTASRSWTRKRERVASKDRPLRMTRLARGVES